MNSESVIRASLKILNRWARLSLRWRSDLWL